MNKGWTETTLREVVTCKGGTSFPPALQGSESGAIPFYKVSDMNAPGNTRFMHVANNYVDPSDLPRLKGQPHAPLSVVFPKVGGALLTNKKRMLSKPSLVDNNIMVVTSIDTSVCNPHFLLMLFESIDLRDLSNPGPLPSINAARVYERDVSLPPLPEQKKIAAVLLKIQRAIETQEKIIQSLRDLKKSTMQHLFTHGLRGEKTKITEIGEIPESWEVVQISEISQERPQNGIFIKDPVWGSGLRYLNVADVYKKLVVDADKLQTVRCSRDAGKSFLLGTGDILFVRSSLKKEGIGMCCVYMGEKTDTLFDCHLIRVRLKQARMNPIYFASYWASATGQNELIRRSKTITMTTINQKSLAEALIPIPVKEEQEKIAEIYGNMQAKIDIHESKRGIFHDLFRTILNKLMTGKIRVADLQIDVAEVEG
jgi:type I restriction enzyme S subunit